MSEEACAALGPLVAGTDYKLKGTFRKSKGGLDFYEANLGENKHADAAVIGIYDVRPSPPST